MTKIEKQVIGVVVIFLLIGGLGVHTCNQAIKDYGGVKKIIVDTGKEIKGISKQIESSE